MFGLGPATKVYLALGATDMRKGLLKVEQLHALARDVFYGRRGTPTSCGSR